MLALSFRAGTQRYAVRASAILRLQERVPLHPVTAVPAGVVGLLRYGDDLLPVVDLGELLQGQATEGASRLLVAQIDGTPPRRLALVVAEAWDMIEVRSTLPRLARPGADFLGSFVRDAGDAELVELAQLLPAELRALARVDLQAVP